MFMNSNSKCGSYVHGFQLNGAGVTVPTDAIAGDATQTLTLTFPQKITEIDFYHCTYKGSYLKPTFTTLCGGVYTAGPLTRSIKGASYCGSSG